MLELALRHLTHVVRAAAIEMWCSARPDWIDRLLRELSFESVPEPQDLSVMCVPFAMPDAVERMRGQLYYTMGDSDLF